MLSHVPHTGRKLAGLDHTRRHQSFWYLELPDTTALTYTFFLLRQVMHPLERPGTPTMAVNQTRKACTVRIPRAAAGGGSAECALCRYGLHASSG